MEAHLTRVNGGHLVRIVGPGFALVRAWEAAGIPLSVVQRAIDQKADRHRQGAAGRSGRPLRIEFCDDDVRALFEEWKRAVGVMADPVAHPEHPDTLTPGTLEPSSLPRPSLSKHLERVSDRLSHLLGRHDLPESFLDQVNQAISAVAEARDRARHARGAARDAIVTAIRPLDAQLMAAARLVLSPAQLAELQHQAEGELVAFKGRLAGEAWQQALGATMDRLLRERFNLPVIDPDAV